MSILPKLYVCILIFCPMFACGDSGSDDRLLANTLTLQPYMNADLVGAAFDMRSEGMWSRVDSANGVTLTITFGLGNVVTDLGGEISLSGAEGVVAESHRMGCARAGSTFARLEMRSAGALLENDFANITCIEPAPDPMDDLFYSDSATPATFLAAYLDIVGFGATTIALSSDDAARIMASESAFAIATSEVVVVRDDNAEPIGEGDVVVAATKVAEPVPPADSGHSLIYSIVFDSDGDPANNWQAQPPFDWDQFQGADRWYQAMWDFTTGTWQLNVTQVADDQTTTSVMSRATAVIRGDTILWFIPRMDFVGGAPTYRVTTFGHDGSFSPDDSGGDVGGPDPTIPLVPLF